MTNAFIEPGYSTKTPALARAMDGDRITGSADKRHKTLFCRAQGLPSLGPAGILVKIARQRRGDFGDDGPKAREFWCTSAGVLVKFDRKLRGFW